jgi:hypothetical protein
MAEMNITPDGGSLTLVGQPPFLLGDLELVLSRALRMFIGLLLGTCCKLAQQ